MIEFKFSCPNCSQHIHCNDAYSGLQINCPTCKNQIIVPSAPGSISSKSAAITPPTSPVAQTSVPQTSPRPNAAGKSKTRLVAICGVAGLVVVGAIAYVLFFNASPSETDTDVAIAKPVNQKQTERVAPSETQLSSDYQKPRTAQKSETSQTLSAEQIMRNVTEKYDSLTTYSAKGKSISIIDMSGVDLSKMPGATAKQKAPSKPQRIENEFSIKLGKPGFYRIEWEGQMSAVKSKGAVWSSGAGDFLLTDMGQTKYIKLKTRALALATATGISGGAANTMPQIFFKGQSSLLSLFQDAMREDDETLDAEPCYVVTGNMMGVKVLLWINKNTFLIKQKQQVLGEDLEIPEMTDAKMEEGLKQLGSNPTDEQKARMKEAMKNMKAMSSQIKGTITESYDDIEINQPMTKADFDYDVPAGTKLSESFF